MDRHHERAQGISINYFEYIMKMVYWHECFEASKISPALWQHVFDRSLCISYMIKMKIINILYIKVQNTTCSTYMSNLLYFIPKCNVHMIFMSFHSQNSTHRHLLKTELCGI